MNIYQKRFNDDLKKLRVLLSKEKDHKTAIKLFLDLHAVVHSSRVANLKIPSYYDNLWDDLKEKTLRIIPVKGKYSIALHIWHLARIEDLTMNILIADEEQLFNTGNWKEKINSNIIDTANNIQEEDIQKFNESVNIKELRNYRDLVGKKTRKIISGISYKELNQKVDPERIKKIEAEGGVIKEARWLLDYWSRKTCSGLLLMPPTRHCLVHINKAMRIKQKFNNK